MTTPRAHNPRWLGAKALGLKTTWRFAFVPMGTPADPVPGVLCLDVGGKLAPGILDHHGGQADAHGAAAAVLAHPEYAHAHLLGPWLSRGPRAGMAVGERWEPTLVLHRAPDWDALVAVHLAMFLIENGDFPPWADALSSYALLVDQGRYRIPATARPSDLMVPHLAFLAAQHVGPTRTDDERCLRRGLDLLDSVVEAVSRSTAGRAISAEDFYDAPAAREWARIGRFADLAMFLEEDWGRAELDRASSPALQADRTPSSGFGPTLVRLPATDGGPLIEVPAQVLQKPSTSALNKYWVRASGRPFFICPLTLPPAHLGANGGTVYPRVIVSLDPTWTADGRKPWLNGLGQALERAEHTARVAAHGQDDRGGPPRWEGATNADPWYDGRGHEYTIIDAPACGSVLPYAEVLRIVLDGRIR
jgi:hypothetical protein